MKIIIELLIVLIVLIAIIVFLICKILNNKINIIKIKLTKAEKKLNDLFNKKFNLTLKIIDFLNNQKNFDENLFHDFLNTNLEEINLVKFNEIIINADNNINNYLSHNEKLVNNKDYIKLNEEINQINTTINSTKNYYNKNTKEYNKLVNKFPTSIIMKLKRQNTKEILKTNQENKLKILNNQTK